MSREERGKLGAARRWGPRRLVNLGDLDPDRRELVLALIGMARAAQKAAGEDLSPTAETTGGHGDDQPSA